MKVIPEPNLMEASRDKAAEQLITSFVPQLLQKELETYGTYRLIPYSRVFPAVCLIVDIVGFIPHVSRNASRGEEGLVQLTTLTNTFVSTLVNHVHTYGGDVVELSSGSSMICIFHPMDRRRKSYLHSCKTAVQCAWELKEMCLLDLSVRTGISFGEMSVGMLGGINNNWRFLITGQCKHQIAMALQHQSSKTLIVSREVKDLLWESKQNDESEGMNNHQEDISFESIINDHGFLMVNSFKTAVSSPSYKTRSTMFSVSREFSSNNMKNDNALFDYYAQLYSFVPRPVIQSSINLLFDSLSCVEEVAVLFVRMDEYEDLLHNGDLTALQRHLLSCQEIIADVGGYVSQFTVDARGCVLVAIWGAPIATFLDNTQRALGAAVRLRYRLMKEKMPCSIAVTSGFAYCGCLGHDIRQEYMVVGDPIDVASRLVGRIKNDIVLDAKTHMSIGSLLANRFRPMPPMPVGPITHGNEPSLVVNYSLNLSNSVGDVFDEYSNMYVDEGIAEALDTTDFESDVALLVLPRPCKDALRGAIKQLNSHSSRRRIMSSSFGSDDLEGLLTDSGKPITINSGRKPVHHHVHRVPHTSNHSFCTIGLVVIEGETGSGKEEAMMWLKRACANRSLRVVSMNIFAEDRSADYSTVARLFRSLILEENFDDPIRQKLVVETLLRETYPNDQNTREKIAYPTVCHALRVTWPNRFSRFSPLPVIQEEEKEKMASRKASTTPSRPGSREGSGKQAKNFFAQSWMKLTGSKSRANSDDDDLNAAGGGGGGTARGVGGMAGLIASAAAVALAAESSSGKQSKRGSMGGVVLGVLSGGGGNENKRTPSASPNPLQGTTTTTSAAAAAANPSVGLKTGTGGGVDMTPPPDEKMHQALIRIFCTLLREQPAVVILEDAHEMDEQSWKLILALTEADVPTLLVMTHQSMDHLTNRNQTSLQLLSDLNTGIKHTVSGRRNAVSSVRVSARDPSRGMFGGGLARGIQGLGSIVAGLIGEDNTVRTSYDTTLTNLKILKKKCIPRDHVIIPPVNPVDVKIRIAASLQIPPSAVDFAFHQTIYSLCDGQVFWLGEVIIHMIEHGVAEFTAQLQGEGWLEVRESRSGGRRSSRQLLSSAVGQLKRGISTVAASSNRMPSGPGTGLGLGTGGDRNSANNSFRRRGSGERGGGGGNIHRESGGQGQGQGATAGGGGGGGGVGAGGGVPGNYQHVSQLLLDTDGRQGPSNGSTRRSSVFATSPRDIQGRIMKGLMAAAGVGVQFSNGSPNGGGGVGNNGSLGGSGGDITASNRPSHPHPIRNPLDQSNRPTSQPQSPRGVGGGSGPGGADMNGSSSPRGPVSGTSSPYVHRSTKDKEDSPIHQGSNPDLHNDSRKRSTILSNVAQTVRARLHLPNGTVTPTGLGGGGVGLGEQQPPPQQQPQQPQQQQYDGVSISFAGSRVSMYSQGGGRRLDGNRRTGSGLAKQKSVFFPKVSDEVMVHGFGNRNSFSGRSSNGGKTGQYDPHMNFRTIVAWRFEQLSLDEQIILRIAAVIGLVFTSDVLDYATPPPMRPYLNTIVSSLVGGYWLTCRTIRQPLGMRFYYSFRHPSVRSILYEKIPEKFRGSTHLTVAEYLERGCSKRAKSVNMSANRENTSSHHLESAAASKQNSANSLADLATGKKGDKGGVDDGIITSARYQHSLLCTAYHYSLSGMPAWKTVEFLCKTCHDLVSSSSVVSLVSAEAAVKLVYWSTKLVRTLPEIVVVLALIVKCRKVIKALWPDATIEVLNFNQFSRQTAGDGAFHDSLFGCGACLWTLAGGDTDGIEPVGDQKEAGGLSRGKLRKEQKSMSVLSKHLPSQMSVVSRLGLSISQGRSQSIHRGKSLGSGGNTSGGGNNNHRGLMSGARVANTTPMTNNLGGGGTPQTNIPELIRSDSKASVRSILAKIIARNTNTGSVRSPRDKLGVSTGAGNNKPGLQRSNTNSRVVEQPDNYTITPRNGTITPRNGTKMVDILSKALYVCELMLSKQRRQMYRERERVNNRMFSNSNYTSNRNLQSAADGGGGGDDNNSQSTGMRSFAHRKPKKFGASLIALFMGRPKTNKHKHSSGQTNTSRLLGLGPSNMVRQQPGLSPPPLTGGGSTTFPPDGGPLDDRSVFSYGNKITGRRRSQQGIPPMMDMWQQRYLQDLEEAELWQRDLIKFLRDETQEKKTDGLTGRIAHPVTPVIDRVIP